MVITKIFYFGFQDRAAIKDNLLHTVKRYLSNKDMNPIFKLLLV